MPTYQYACTNAECDNRFELVQAFTDPSVTECPVCGERVRKVYGSVGVVFKGSGFYRNDSREGANGSTGETKSGSDTSESAPAGESKPAADAKPAAAEATSRPDKTDSVAAPAKKATEQGLPKLAGTKSPAAT